jgi:hypothetical protein
VDITADDNRSSALREESSRRIEHILTAYQQSDMAREASIRKPPVETNWTTQRVMSTWMNQFSVLAGRGFRNAYRDRFTYGVRYLLRRRKTYLA